MKVLNNLLAILLVLVFCVPFVHATAYSVVFTPIDNEILPNETSTFELAISNFDATRKRLQVYTIDPEWILKVDPVSVRVPGDSSETFTVKLKPKSGVNYGSSGIAVNVKDVESGNLIRKTLFVAVKSFDSISGTYAASVAFDILLPTEVDPQEATQLMIRMRNRNALDISDMTMKLSSPHFNQETPVDLGPLAEKMEYYTFRLDPLETPGDYTLLAELRYRDQTVSKVEKEYTVVAYNNVEKDDDTRSFLFRTQRTLELHNDGNQEITTTASLPVNLITRWFSSTEPDASYEGGMYSWSVTLPADGRMEIKLVQNYRWLIAFIILTIIGGIAYYVYRSPVVALKEVIGIHHGEGVSDVKIRLFIKNRTNAVIQGVEVFDKIPRIATLTKTHALGTIKPSKVTQLKSGTLLRWNLDILEPYEERILTYTFQSRLKIIGKLNMAESKIKFETGKGQERIIYSNNLLFTEKK